MPHTGSYLEVTRKRNGSVYVGIVSWMVGGEMGQWGGVSVGRFCSSAAEVKALWHLSRGKGLHVFILALADVSQ